MAYLKKDDYTLRIIQDNLNQILTQAAENSGFSEDEIRLDAELTAQAEIGGYLSGRYKIEDEFAKDATAPADIRNKTILKCALDISLFNLYVIINPRDVPEIREKNYDRCLEMLAAYRDSTLIIYPIYPTDGGIEVRPEDEGGDSRFIITSHTKFISRPFNDPTGLIDS